MRFSLNATGHERLAIGALLGAWAICIFIVYPVGEFPLFDDWAYLQTVNTLVTEHRFVLSDWAAPNLISQILWGALFSLPFGASYIALRFSTLVAVLIGAVVFFRLLKSQNHGSFLSLLAVGCIFLNPLATLLCFSFMTDIPFLVLEILSLFFIFRFFDADKNPVSQSVLAFAVAIMFGVAALLCRQVAMFIPLAFACAVVARSWGRVTITNLATAFFPLLLFVFIQQAYEVFLQASAGGVPAAFGRQTHNLFTPFLSNPAALLRALYEFAMTEFYYFGHMLLPLALPICAAILHSRWSKRLCVWIWIGFAATAAMLSVMSAFSNDIIRPDVVHQLSADGISFGVAVYIVWTAASIFGGLLLLACFGFALETLWHSLRDNRALTAKLVFCAAAIIILSGTLALVEMKFHRYLLMFLPVMIVFMATGLRGEMRIPVYARVVALLWFTAMAAYSLLDARDVMAEKRVQKQALSSLLASGVPRQHIDAGWELNGADQFKKYGRLDKRNIWYEKRDYIVGTHPLKPGYTEIITYPIPRVLPLYTKAKQNILVQVRAD